MRESSVFLPCIFLLWNLGDPSRLFLMELSLLLQWALEGEPGGVGSSWSVSFVPGKGIFEVSVSIINVWFHILRCILKVGVPI